MNPEKTQRRYSFIINTLYWALIITLIYLCLKYVASWIMPFIIGFCIAYALKPVVEFLHRKLKGGRKLWAVLVVLFAYAILGVLLWLIGVRIVLGLEKLFAMLPDMYTNDIEPSLTQLNATVIEFLSDLSPTISDTLNSVMNALKDFVLSTSKSVVSWIALTSAKVPSFLLGLLFTVMSSIFISIDYNNVRTFIFKQLPAKYIGWLYDARSFVHDTLLKYLRAYSIIMSITFVELSIALTILGVKSSIWVALVVALVDIVPILGTGTIVIPWIAISLVQGDYRMAIGLLIMYLVIAVVRNVIEPRIVGKSIGLNPLLTLMCMYIGLVNFGVIGMLILPMLLLITINFQDSGKIRFWKT